MMSSIPRRRGRGTVPPQLSLANGRTLPARTQREQPRLIGEPDMQTNGDHARGHGHGIHRALAIIGMLEVFNSFLAPTQKKRPESRRIRKSTVRRSAQGCPIATGGAARGRNFRGDRAASPRRRALRPARSGCT